MSLTSTRHILLLGVDLLILVVGVGHLPGILERSRVPFEAATANDTVRVTRILNMPAAGGLREGDAILRFAGVPSPRSGSVKKNKNYTWSCLMTGTYSHAQD